MMDQLFRNCGNYVQETDCLQKGLEFKCACYVFAFLLPAFGDNHFHKSKYFLWLYLSFLKERVYFQPFDILISVIYYYSVTSIEYLSALWTLPPCGIA